MLCREEEVEAFERNDEGVEDSDEEEGDAKGPWAAVSSSPPVHKVEKQLRKLIRGWYDDVEEYHGPDADIPY